MFSALLPSPLSVLLNVRGRQVIPDINCKWRDLLRRRADLLPSVPMCVEWCPPNVSCLHECVGGAVSDLCACLEVVWRLKHCHELQVCQYVSPSSLHVTAYTRPLGGPWPCPRPWSLPCCCLTLPASVCPYSWRRCAGGSLISLSPR